MNFALLSMMVAEGYRPFLDPLPVWQSTRWPWLLVPLCIGVSLVYKSARCKSMKTVARETASAATFILLGMVGAAVLLYFIVRGMEIPH